MNDASSYEQFFRSEFRSLASLGAWMTGDVAQGEDLAQEALGRVHRRWSQVRAYERPGTYARRVLLNLAANERRRRGRERRAVQRVGDLAAVPSGSSPAPNVDAPGAADPTLWAAVAALPTQQRAAVALRYLEDLPNDRIAEALGCATSTVRVHLHRAHERLGVALGATHDASGPIDEEPR